MGFYKTKNCFFTGKEVISCDETDGTCLDGYYYRIELYGKVREFKLHRLDDWQNDTWLKENGEEFLDLINQKGKWKFFSDGRKLNEIKSLYNRMKDK